MTLLLYWLMHCTVIDLPPRPVRAPAPILREICRRERWRGRWRNYA